MENQVRIDHARLMQRLDELGDVGRNSDGQLSRLAASDADKAGRDLVVRWMMDAGLAVAIDQIGNIFGTWPRQHTTAPVMVGSHIDSVIDAGILDGCYGVLAGLAIVEAMQAADIDPTHPITIAVFTNEEGVRYSPDMMGSLVYAGGLDVRTALASPGTDGTTLGDELKRIGYAGDMLPGSIVPKAFLELHIEQGPVLEASEKQIGAVADLQGISWQRLTIEGVANHAGTTPIELRIDAGLAAAKINVFLRDLVAASESASVATIGTMQLLPNAVNVVPRKAIFTVDLRDPDEDNLLQLESELAEHLERLEQTDKVTIARERLARFSPVTFDVALVELIENVAEERGLPWMRMTSGAGHDAQMISRICPSAMIFVPSCDGVSHNPREHTADDDLIAGAEVLLGALQSICCAT